MDGWTAAVWSRAALVRWMAMSTPLASGDRQSNFSGTVLTLVEAGGTWGQAGWVVFVDDRTSDVVGIPTSQSARVCRRRNQTDGEVVLEK